MIIYHYKIDPPDYIISGECGDCILKGNKAKPKIIKIGSGLCQMCDYNEKQNGKDFKVYCLITGTRIIADHYWYDEKWVSEREYNLRFISD